MCEVPDARRPPPALREISLGSADSGVAETYRRPDNTTVPGSDEEIGISVYLFIDLCSGRLVGATCHNGFVLY